MTTDDLDFLAMAARKVCQGMAPHVVILDFSGLDHWEDPILRRTVLDALVTEEAPTGTAVPEFFVLTYDQLVILIEESRLADRRAALQRVAESLETAGRGGLKAHWFVMPRDGELLLKLARQRAADMPPLKADFPTQEGQLGQRRAGLVLYRPALISTLGRYRRRR